MASPAFIAHQIDGRVRIHIPSRQRDAGYFSALKENLAACPGVDAVEVRPLTGGVLVRHHTAAAAIARYAEEHGLFSVRDAGEDRRPVSAQIAERFSALDQRLSHSSGGKVDLSTAAFFLFCGAGLLQLLRRKVLPAGVTLLWYAAFVLPKSSTSAAPDPR